MIKKWMKIKANYMELQYKGQLNVRRESQRKYLRMLQSPIENEEVGYLYIQFLNQQIHA
jgi:hypothetical protein